MTGKERMTRILRHEPVDRIGLYEHFWGDTHREWHEKGYLRQDESFEAHFQFDMQDAGHSPQWQTWILSGRP